MRRTLVAALVLAAGACAPALRQAPPAPGGPSGAALTPARAAALVAEADAAAAPRTPEGMRRAEALAREACGARPPLRDAYAALCRARLWLAQHEADKAERAARLDAALEAAQWCGAAFPSEPECSYWLGAALGLRAKAMPSTGLSAVPLIRAAFERAAAEIPTFDHGGGDRALAIFFSRAPGWPVGPGDPDVAVEHARKALEIDPAYPPNHLALAEALAAAGEDDASREAARAAGKLAGKSAEAGDPDANEWIVAARSAESGKFL